MGGITVGIDQLSPNNRTMYQITVCDPGSTFPSLPFLHKGDEFEDANGNTYSITRSIMQQKITGEGLNDYYYLWIYEADKVIKYHGRPR